MRARPGWCGRSSAAPATWWCWSPPTPARRSPPRSRTDDCALEPVRGGISAQMTEFAPGHPEILRIVAPNPGPMTLEGTNTYVYGADPCVVIDPGTEDAGHLDRVRAAGAERGGIGTVLITHSHIDHISGADQLGAPVVLAEDGEEHGGLRALATPGHAADHVVYLSADGVCFCGDLVLGLGSTIVPPGGNSLAAFMDSLALLQAEGLALMCPGHGPWITDPEAKLAEYVNHRLERERRLVATLDEG